MVDKKLKSKVSMLTPYKITVGHHGGETLFEVNYHHAGILPIKEEFIETIKMDMEWKFKRIEYPVGKLIDVKGDKRIYNKNGSYIDKDCEGWEEAKERLQN